MCHDISSGLSASGRHNQLQPKGREDVAQHGSSRDKFPLQQPRPGTFIKESVLGVRSVEGNGAEQHGRGMSKSAGLFLWKGNLIVEKVIENKVNIYFKN